MKFTAASGPNDVPNVPNNVPNRVPNVSDRECIILRMLANDEKLSTAAIARELDVTEKTIKRDIAELQQIGVLVREGGTRGRWVVRLGDK